MKLKKTDLAELKKSSKKALMGKLAEAKLELTNALLNKRASRTTKRSIAQLSTLISQIKE